MKKFWKKEKLPETARRIRANNPEINAAYKYANNYISTSKYNLFTFLPKNLFEQFQRLANAYFLVLLILQVIPQISSVPYYTTLVPLTLVLAVSAIKDMADDIQRHRSDNQVNNRKSWVIRDGELKEMRWSKVVVGDIIKMEDDQFVAADLFLLSTSEPNSLCYIETAELDGETNLKVKQAIPETAELNDDIDKFSSFDADIVCEAPNNVLSKFEGRMTWQGQTYALDNEKILLRGCVLRNTKWCYGLVIFAGKDTKLMMNSGVTQFKRTHIDRLMNVLIIGILIFLLSVCLFCTICCGVWEGIQGYNFQAYLPWESFVPEGNRAGGATVIAALVFFSYIIILNTVVPISLYVSVEIIRFGHSWWINWDQKMYYAKTDTPARSRTTTLNEELGQIEYIFSDKTGTLTQNIMSFNKCSIAGKSYGDVLDSGGNPIDVTSRTPKVSFADNPMAEESFVFYDQRLKDLVDSHDASAVELFRCLALCHTVMPDEKDDQLIYQAQSPDEGALVSAARNFGFVFRSRTPSSITITEFGKEETYELLCILDFNNVRKRMSVILRKDNKIVLYCKGADTTVYERLHSAKCAEMKEYTTSHLNDFAQDGLRTLCIATKEIDPNYYAEWKIKHHEASTSMESRDEKLSEVYEEIEQDLILIGATAIEDKLQDGVPDTIAHLALAGIKIWVLTGDKQETAINIGYSCKLLTEEMEEIFVVDGETYQEVLTQVTSARDTMNKILSEPPKTKVEVVSFANDAVSDVKLGPTDPQFGGFAIVINGHSLVHALQKDMEMLLLETGSMCKAVICCRVTPLQKALVVDLVKRHKKSITLAIGDGANDVSMIKTAHIGVGISGQEGMQAVLASDFSLAQFRYLERLLLVHGRWSYLRMCKFLKYFFYKNFAFTLCHFWYAFYCGFSAQTLFDPYFISFYNVFYTSLPVLFMGVFDKDVNEEYSQRYPKLYYPGHLDLFFNKKVFAQSLAEGVITSAVLFFIPYGAFHDAIQPDGTDLADHKSFGVVVASALTIAVTLRCALDTLYWTGFNHFVIWGSIAFYFIATFILYSDPLGYYAYLGSARNVMSTANFWFTVTLCVVVLLLPVVAERFYFIDTRPTLNDKVRLKQKISKSKSKSGDLILRRASTMRRSTRSIGRSGYAFAHSEGFGRLITSGTNMRSRSGDINSNRKRDGGAKNGRKQSGGSNVRATQSVPATALSTNGDVVVTSSDLRGVANAADSGSAFPTGVASNNTTAVIHRENNVAALSTEL